VVTPLVVPLAVNVPDAVVPRAKHGDEVPKLKLVTLTELLLLCVSVTVKLKAVEPLLVSVAVQLPFTTLFEFPPHAVSIIAAAQRIEK
jgi:hypothetical protein